MLKHVVAPYTVVARNFTWGGMKFTWPDFRGIYTDIPHCYAPGTIPKLMGIRIIRVRSAHVSIYYSGPSDRKLEMSVV